MAKSPLRKGTASKARNTEREEMLMEYAAHLRSVTNKHGRPYQEKTVTGYLKSARALDQWMGVHRVGENFTALDTEALNQFFRWYWQNHTPGGTNTVQRNLRHLFTWLEEEFDTPHPWKDKRFQRYSPLTDAKPKTLSTDFVRDLLRVTGNGSPRVRDFASVRDHAIIRILTEGVRAEELIGLTLEDLDLSSGVARVVPLKSARDSGTGRLVPLQPKTVAALSRYMRLRRDHPVGDSEWLWLGIKTRCRLKYSGLYGMVNRRARQAGYDAVTPHQFRHTWTHDLLEAGISGEDVMTAAGWKDRSMLKRYAADMATSRALKAVSKLGDRY